MLRCRRPRIRCSHHIRYAKKSTSASPEASALQRARLAEDPYFHEALYNMLIDLRATNELLDLDTNHLERHLRSNGGLPSGIVDGPIGPLAPGQVHFKPLKAQLKLLPEIQGQYGIGAPAH